jgi:hypothetical protein
VRYLFAGVFVLVLAAFRPAPAWATTAVFYQPQQRDISGTGEHWSQSFGALRAMGIDTVTVQWTRYGNAFSNDLERKWLADRIRDARAAGLDVIVGLQADPDFFSRQQQPEAALPAYLAGVRRDDIAMARQWVRELGDQAIAGWYLPAEIDDQRWRESGARALLEEHLRTEVRELRKVADKPVFASTFFTGHMAPSVYVAMLNGLAGTGVRLWVQDGAGTGKLSRVERELYLGPLGSCDVPIGGVVFEVFRQVGTDRAFSAQPLPSDEAVIALQQRAPCGRDSVFFELRYLPGVPGLPSP